MKYKQIVLVLLVLIGLEGHTQNSVEKSYKLNEWISIAIENNLDFELKHKVIIDRFGRYPHRNAILNRDSTQDELAFLNEPNSSF